MLRLMARPVQHFLLVSVMAVVAMIIVSCGGNSSSLQGPTMGTVLVSISDPPSCMPPNGHFTHVFITVRSVQAHTSATADDNSAGWQELAPQLASAPTQIDLFSKPDTRCVLAQLGSASLPVGNLQQIRLLLVSNSPAAGAAVPSPNACASIVQEGNGTFRLKPTLTAGVVSANSSGIGGQVVDSVTKKPISGNVIVALEQPDSMGIDRIVMQAAADTQGNFRFCPLPTGTFDIVVVALGTANLPYNATAVVNVPNGTNLNVIPLVAEAGATGPAILQGFVTAKTATAGATADVTLAALQTINVSSSVTRQLTIPLQNTQATAMTPAVTSTGLISITDSKNCPMGSPTGANCAQYTLVVPASNPSVGIFVAGGFTFSAPASGDVLFSVDANAAVPMTAPMNGGKADCTPSEIVTSTDASTPPKPLKVTPAMTTNVARTDFTGCS